MPQLHRIEARQRPLFDQVIQKCVVLVLRHIARIVFAGQFGNLLAGQLGPGNLFSLIGVEVLRLRRAALADVVRLFQDFVKIFRVPASVGSLGQIQFCLDRCTPAERYSC